MAPEDGEVRFRNFTSLREMDTVPEEIFGFMLGITLNTMDEYGNNILKVLMGVIDADAAAAAQPDEQPSGSLSISDILNK